MNPLLVIDDCAEKFIVVVVAIHRESETPLAEVRDTNSASAGFLCLRKGGKEKRGKDRDNCDYHQQFDKGESSHVLTRRGR